MAKNKKQSEKKEKNPKKKKNEADKVIQSSEEITSNETQNEETNENLSNEVKAEETAGEVQNSEEEVNEDIQQEEEEKQESEQETTEYFASVTKEETVTPEGKLETPATEREKNPDINAALEAYIKKNETTSISDYTLNGMGLKEEHYTGLTNIHFGKYSIKRANPNAQTWAIVNNVEGV